MPNRGESAGTWSPLLRKAKKVSQRLWLESQQFRPDSVPRASLMLILIYSVTYGSYLFEKHTESCSKAVARCFFSRWCSKLMCLKEKASFTSSLKKCLNLHLEWPQRRFKQMNVHVYQATLLRTPTGKTPLLFSATYHFHQLQAQWCINSRFSAQLNDVIQTGSVAVAYA